MAHHGPRTASFRAAAAACALACAGGLGIAPRTASAQIGPPEPAPAVEPPATSELAATSDAPSSSDAATAAARDPAAGTEPAAAEWPQPLQELPLPPPDDTPLAVDAPPASAEAPSADLAAPEPLAADEAHDDAVTPGEMGNADVLAMAQAQFSDSTILAAIAANPARFDVSPRALVALKTGGVSDHVLEAMIANETARQQAAAAEPVAVEPADTAVSPQLAKLEQMIEQLAKQQEAASQAAKRENEPAVDTTSQSPRVWLTRAGERTALAPTIAQVAFAEEGRGNTFKTLQGLAGKALAFVNPGVSGIATSLGGLFGSNGDEERMTVWALAGSAAARELGAKSTFEIEYARIPGVNPDAYAPAVVRLIPTSDNYRLVAAAKTQGTPQTSMPTGPILEELQLAELARLGRGHYRITTPELGAGEYALVLRPIEKPERKRRKSDPSLGELLGGTTQILYLTWDFAVVP